MSVIPVRKTPTLGIPTTPSDNAPVAGNWAVIAASEGGKDLGREPPGIKPVITGAGAPKRTIRKESRP